LGCVNIFPLGVQGPPNVNLGPPDISETISLELLFLKLIDDFYADFEARNQLETFKKYDEKN